MRVLKIVHGRTAVVEALKNLGMQGFEIEQSKGRATRGDIQIMVVQVFGMDPHDFAGLNFHWIDFGAHIPQEDKEYLLRLVRWPNGY